MKTRIGIIALVVFTMITACESEPEAWSYFRSRTYQTENIVDMRSTLFKAEDLDWPEETYLEITDIFISEEDILPEDQIQARMKAQPDRHSSQSHLPEQNLYVARQEVRRFVDETAAAAAAELLMQRYSLGLGPIPDEVALEFELNYWLMGCRYSIAPDIGKYRTCELVAQHGRYVTIASMNVDGIVIQMDDWIDLLTVIQNRLITRVEQEDLSL